MDLRFSDATATAAERAALAPVVAVDGDRPTRVGGAGSGRRHLLLPALAAVQAEIGWISEGALMEICRRLHVPPAEAYGVASFYALLATTERPRRVVHVCDDIACAGFGGADLAAALNAGVSPEGEAAGDGMWVTSPCLGQCDRAPAAYAQLAGEPDRTLAPASAATVGAVLAGETVPEPAAALPQQGEDGPRLLRRVGVVDPGSFAAYEEAGGLGALRRALAMGPEAVLAEVEVAGLRGRGGAAFPTAVKWRAAAAAPAPRYLICNADESEPGTFKDRVLMEGDPAGLIEAMIIAAFATGAGHGYVYLRGEYPQAAGRLTAMLEQFRAAGYLGGDVAGSGFAFDVELRRGQGAYICGEETALMNSIEGLRGEPRSKPPFPTEVGLFGRPTVVNNVETLVNVLDIVERGGAAYAATGTAESTGTRLFCLAGAVLRPGIYEVPLGTTLGELLSRAGAGEATTVLLGGAAGRFVTAAGFDLPLTFEDAAAAGLTLGSGAITVFGPGADLAAVAGRIARFFREESCGQCVPCRVGTVRLEEALARLAGGGEGLEPTLIDEIDRAMRDASICGLGHTAASAVRSALDLGLLEAGA